MFQIIKYQIKLKLSEDWELKNAHRGNYKTFL